MKPLRRGMVRMKSSTDLWWFTHHLSQTFLSMPISSFVRPHWTPALTQVVNIVFPLFKRGLWPEKTANETARPLSPKRTDNLELSRREQEGIQWGTGNALLRCANSGGVRALDTLTTSEMLPSTFSCLSGAREKPLPHPHPLPYQQNIGVRFHPGAAHTHQIPVLRRKWLSIGLEH